MGQSLPSVYNGRRRNRIIHISASRHPLRSDITICGVKMSGNRWRLADQLANCYPCIDKQIDMVLGGSGPSGHGLSTNAQ